MPVLQATLKDGAGNAIDLNPGGTPVGLKFFMSTPADVVKINQNATIVQTGSGGSAVNKGVVQYQWGATDTDTIGYYNAEFEVTYSSSKKETFPDNSFFLVEILKDLVA